MSEICVDENSNLLALEEKKLKKTKYYIEPATFLIFFSIYLSRTVVVNQILVQTCIVFNFNESSCLEIGKSSETEEIKIIDSVIQPHVTKILMIIQILDNVITIFVSFLAGAFSDRYGRKPILNYTFTGTTIYYGLLCVLVLISRQMPVSPWAFGLALIIFVGSGGFSCIISGVLSYTSDSTTEENRSKRITIVENMYYLGTMLGSLFSSIAFNYVSSLEIFFASFICCLLANFYVVFFLEETVKVHQKDSICTQLKTIKSSELFTGLYKVAVRKRTNNNRKILWCLLVSAIIWLFVWAGHDTVFYLFERYKFTWTVRDANLYESLTQTLNVIGSFIGVYLLKQWLKCSDIIVIIISLISKICSLMVIGFASVSWMLYAACFVGFFGNLGTSIGRSMISKIVEKNETGKVFSLMLILEDISMILSSQIYGFIYIHSYQTFPASFVFLSAGMFMISLLNVFFIYFLQRSNNKLESTRNLET